MARVTAENRMLAMHEKRIGRLEVTTYPDSESVSIKYWCNQSVYDVITLRSNEDIDDLQHAICCVMHERARLAAQRREGSQK